MNVKSRPIYILNFVVISLGSSTTNTLKIRSCAKSIRDMFRSLYVTWYACIAIDSVGDHNELINVELTVNVAEETIEELIEFAQLALSREFVVCRISSRDGKEYTVSSV